MTLNLLTWLLALSPVIVVLVLMLGLRWGGSKAGALAWFAAVLVAFFFFGAGPRLIAYTQAKAILLSLDVLYIVWAALLLYLWRDGRARGLNLPPFKVIDDRQLLRLALSDPSVTVLEFGQQKHNLEEVFLSIVEGGEHGQ